MRCRLLTSFLPGGVLLIAGCSTSSVQDASAARSPAAVPLMAVLERFTAADVPALGSAEAEAPCGDWTNAPTPANLRGKGLAQYPMLYLDQTSVDRNIDAESSGV
ncbi:MAG TPA: hypothetical protein VNZ64_07005 [Candidatus Acidoferrum sp.]|jgi:hypothetical protein|nr:hypothetical protein [Candidatus Acidoferrum sp.]